MARDGDAHPYLSRSSQHYIMTKKILSVFLVLIMTFVVVQVKGSDTPPINQTAHALAGDQQKPKTVEKPSEAVKPADTAQNEPQQPVQQAPAPAAPAKPTTCREAIAAVIPAELQSGFITVLTKENGLETVDRVGATNRDGSTDYGCFQINDRWHPDYFASGDWRDPVWAAQYALKIYQGRQASNGNGWSAWYAVQGILW